MLDGALHSLSAERLDEARGIIDAALAQQRATIRELRDLSFALEPVVLRDHGFAPRSAPSPTRRRAPTASRSTSRSRPSRSATTAGIALYTILRELVDQALRRGTPTHMRIEVSPTPDGGVVATVADDAEPERRRRSLEAIEERVVQLHGTLEVQDGRRGTETRVSLPGAHSSTVVTIETMADENGHGTAATSCSSGRPRGTGCASAEGDPPPVGAELEDDGHELVVTKVGPSPLPGDSRPCAYTTGRH